MKLVRDKVDSLKDKVDAAVLNFVAGYRILFYESTTIDLSSSGQL